MEKNGKKNEKKMEKKKNIYFLILPCVYDFRTGGNNSFTRITFLGSLMIFTLKNNKYLFQDKKMKKVENKQKKKERLRKKEKKWKNGEKNKNRICFREVDGDLFEDVKTKKKT